jgi:hypothetical protein
MKGRPKMLELRGTAPDMNHLIPSDTVRNTCYGFSYGSNIVIRATHPREITARDKGPRLLRRAACTAGLKLLRDGTLDSDTLKSVIDASRKANPAAPVSTKS